jgi:type II secretory pathway component PulF
MPTYSYVCANSRGQNLRGRCEALDKNDLIRILAADGLFLESWKVEESVPAAAALPQAPPVEQTTNADRPPILRRYSRFSLQLILLLLLTGVIVVMAVRTVTHQDLGPVTEQLRHLMVTDLAPGRTRLEVEQKFNLRAGETQASNLTHYFVPPDLIYDVPYDNTGGEWSPQNRINGMVMLRTAKVISAR